MLEGEALNREGERGAALIVKVTGTCARLIEELHWA